LGGCEHVANGRWPELRAEVFSRHAHQLKVTLEGVEPPVWRRIVVPSEFTLYDLHCVIQAAMGWENCHLHDFTIKRQRYVVPDSEEFGNPLDDDFGDSWNHIIVVEKILEDAENLPPRCIDGARACPPEDSGGPWGYSEKLEALANPDDEESGELRD
jgi:hypothetical protein